MSGLTIIRDGKSYRVPQAVEAAQEHAVVSEGKVTAPANDAIERWLADPSAVQAEPVAPVKED